MKKKQFLLSMLLLCGSVLMVAQNGGLAPQITNIDSRSGQLLDGAWRTIVDPFENGYYDYRLLPTKEGYFKDRPYSNRTQLQEYDFDADRTLLVPGDWNTQRDELYYYEGTVWYRTRFAPDRTLNHRQFLYFEAVNHDAKVYLNGELIGTHEGGFTPFNIEVTGKVMDADNSLVVKVDNRRKPEAVPTVNADWWNYGGITRSVRLVSVPRSFIRDYSIQLQKGNAKLISGWVQVDGASAPERVRVKIPELNSEVSVMTDAQGRASFSIPLKRATLWEPENPKLYDVVIASGSDETTDRIGFRTIETSGTDILLNGRKTYLRGISIHEETAYYSGRAHSREHAVTLLTWAKQMGCNFVRLAHYPHNENMVRVAEEMGLMVWSEIPVYWTIHWSNPATYTNAEAQLTDMITRDKNRANVIIWSIANETPISVPRTMFLTNLAGAARRLDNTRLVAAAMEKEEVAPGHMTVHDPMAEVLDLISFNQYVGWYDGRWEKCDRVEWTFDVKKPVFVSEFGGGARFGHHGKDTDMFTEEYLVRLYERSVAMLQRMPGLAGSTPWILKDFRSPRRHLPGIQDDFNRKGLVSDQGQKKKAFFVMKRWYEDIAETEKAAQTTKGK